MIRFISKLRTILSMGLIAVALTMTLAAQAQAQDTGIGDLGQSLPRADDLSVSPNWHVYVFHRDGIEYIQINDQQDQVRAAFATSNGLYLVLPVGIDARQVSTPQRPIPFDGSAALSETVYLDKSVQVLMAPYSGGVQWQVKPTPAPAGQSATTRQGVMQSMTCKVHSCGGDIMAY